MLLINLVIHLSWMLLDLGIEEVSYCVCTISILMKSYRILRLSLIGFGNYVLCWLWGLSWKLEIIKEKLH